MANNRIIYQSEALYVSDNYDSTSTGQHAQLSRVQSANYSFTVPRTDINQFGVLSRIGTLNTETPTVSVDLSYYLTNGFNEAALGFFVETGTPTDLTGGFGNEHLLTDTGRNIYIYTVPEGQDAIANNAQINNGAVIGIGNTFLTDYTLDLSVGSIPTVTVSMEGQNIVSDINLNQGAAGTFIIDSGLYSGEADPGTGIILFTSGEGADDLSFSLGDTGVFENLTGIIDGDPNPIELIYTGTSGDALAFYTTSTVTAAQDTYIDQTNATIEKYGEGIISNISNAGINPEQGTELGTIVSLAAPTNQTGANIPIALRPGDISLSFGTPGNGKPLVDLDGNDGAHIQSLSISLPLSRTALEKLGSRFAYARAVDFPVNASLTVNAIVNETTSQALTTLLDDTTTFKITATIKDPSDGSNKMIYEFKGCQLQDEAYSSSIGANKTVDLTFTTQIGGPTDTDNNILVSGSYSSQGAPFS